MSSSRFAEVAHKLVELVGSGSTLVDASAHLDLPYATVRGWVAEGRRNPSGPYGAWERALAVARAPTSWQAQDDDHERGPVESAVEDLIAACTEWDERQRVAAAPALVLARSVDTLASTKAGSSGLALAAVSRRLEDGVSALPTHTPGDPLDELVEQYKARRAAIGNGGASGPAEAPDKRSVCREGKDAW